ncbi:unnamed protein product [Cylicostephanus goldi]|uniref:DNA topoisomerase type IIA domain-containing protein n=1 Tax=Cylicostephanus goldi TaxID=71465 RepID=A0A3P6UVR1_CYLGO|nr:unnamed protein product [Cylicostephanus goldi]
MRGQFKEDGGGDRDRDLEGKLSDYDYLVGMALIKLSEEEKNKLLKESDDKLRELRDLESKTWADLWNADLEVFLEALEKQEAKEKADLEISIKNAMKKFTKEDKSRNKRTAAFAAEVFPAKDGMRVLPNIDKSLKEKYEKISAAATREKKPKEPKPPKEPKEKKPKKEGDDIKKFMTGEKKSPKKKKRDEWNSDESSTELSDVDDLEESALFDDEDDDVVEEVLPPKKDRASRGP